MPIMTRQANGVTVLDVSGAITAGESGGQLHSAVNNALNGGATRILMNWQYTTNIDSSGIGECIASLASVTNKGATLKMASVPPQMQNALNTTKLNNVFDVHDTEDGALKSFA